MSLPNVTWHEYLNSIQFQQNNNTIILKIGDCIIYESRELPVRIDRFIGYRDVPDSGPLGFEYLPWRGDRWATPTWGLRGNLDLLFALLLVYLIMVNILNGIQLKLFQLQLKQ